MADTSSTEEMTIFPAGTKFYRPQGPDYPDGFYVNIIKFPDEDSAIVFFEWCKQQCVDAEREE